MDVKALMLSRRSIRKYSDREVDEALLDDLLRTSARTSTCGNMQLYSVVVCRRKDSIARLAPFHFNQPAAAGAKVLLTFCADYHRFSLWCRQNNAEPGYDNFESFVSAAVDTIALAQSFSLLAEDAGLGICYLGTTSYNAAPIAEALGLPQLCVPLVTLSLGYPDESPSPTDRIDLEGWVHREAYHDYSASDITRIYGYKESLPENVEFKRANDKESLAQIFTDIRYTRKDSEYFSEQFVAFLHKQGFLK